MKAFQQGVFKVIFSSYKVLYDSAAEIDVVYEGRNCDFRFHSFHFSIQVLIQNCIFRRIHKTY